MSKQSQIKAYFKIKTADEMEVEELLFTQASIAYNFRNSYARYNASRIIIVK
jgi:hypothetical protein